MTLVIMFLLIVGFAGLGFWRGGMRLGLALLPLLLASILFWLLGGLFYRLDFLVNLGLMWPGTILFTLGLLAGYTLRFYVDRKLPKERNTADRIVGSVVGVLIALVISWLGLVYFNVKAASDDRPVSATNVGMARALNGAVVRWIPGIGAGADSLTNAMDIAMADEEVRRRAVEDLDLANLRDVPEVTALLEDDATAADIDAAAQGSITALFRLQKNPLVIALFDSEQIQEVLKRLSLDDISEAVRKVEAGQTAGDRSDGYEDR